MHVHVYIGTYIWIGGGRGGKENMHVYIGTYEMEGGKENMHVYIGTYII